MKTKIILKAAEMQAADMATIEQIGIGQDVLMERAALAVASCVKRHNPKRVVCVCGIGNNGGDALAVARILLAQGIHSEVFVCGDSKKLKASVQKQYDIFIKIGGKIITTVNFDEYDIIVDGIFGVGLDRNIEGAYAEVITAMNAASDSGVKVISVDIPSGIHTDTGAVMGVAAKADETVAFAYYKPGHLLNPGAEYCGNVSVEDIGIDWKYITNKNEPGLRPKIFTRDKNDFVLLPKRSRDGNKGSFGRVLVIAGSSAMYGACYLSALASLRMGAGLVDIYTHEVNRTAVQTMLPEAILHAYRDVGFESVELYKLINAADCVVIGPGLSTNETAKLLVKNVLQNCDKMIVADADALNCIASDTALFELLKSHTQSDIILTPHPGELSRLTGKSVTELKTDYVASIKAFAKETNCVVVGKDAGTVVSDGEYTYINQTGNSGMATAGSGDVLSGIIGALCAQGETAFDAAWKGVFLHGKAGDTALSESNCFSLMAGDIANALKEIIRE